MKIETNIENSKYPTAITFNSFEVPVIKDIATRYSAREKDFLRENPKIDFIFHYIIESPKNSGKPITIPLSTETLTFLSIELSVETVDYIEKDLKEFREILTHKPYYSSQEQGSSGTDSDADHVNIESLDDKIAIASNIYGDLELFLIESEQSNLQNA